MARLLAPAGVLYGQITAHRMQRPPLYRARLPVICVGNFTAGGTGKTPFVRTLTGLLRDLGHTPVVLSRGYGGRLAGPHKVDLARDTAADVGDEPLLLATSAPVVIARDRAAGAAAIEQSDAGGEKASVIVMDDGLQNPALKKDLTIALVDGARGFGNGRCVPAGPLRAPLPAQITIVDVVVLNHGDGRTSGPGLAPVFLAANTPVLSAHVLPSGETSWLTGSRVVAYAGIGVPARFASSLAAAGADVCEVVSFPDHHTFSDTDAERLLALAKAKSARLVTTEKDAVRLRGATGTLATLQRESQVLAVGMHLQDRGTDMLRALIAERFSPSA